MKVYIVLDRDDINGCYVAGAFRKKKEARRLALRILGYRDDEIKNPDKHALQFADNFIEEAEI